MYITIIAYLEGPVLIDSHDFLMSTILYMCFFAIQHRMCTFTCLLSLLKRSINMLIPPQKTIFELEEEEEKAVEIQRWQDRRRRASLEPKRVK